MNRKIGRTLAALSALLAAAVVGCTDTTVQPKSTVSSATIFNDPNSYQAFIAKIYGGLALTGQTGPTNSPDIAGLDEGFAEYIRVWWQLNELSTDEAVVAWGDPGLPEINSQQWVSSNVWVQAMYDRVYFQASMVNEFLRQTTDAVLAGRSNVTPALKAQIQTYRAEARFLRALSYWHGLDMFGSIPLVTENDAINGPPPMPVAKDSMYRYIVSELTAIQGALPAPGAAAYGRATQWADQMLLAHVYLNAGLYTGTTAYDKALTAASAVIGSGVYSLNPVFRNNFTADNNISPEIIFAVPFDGLRTQTWGGTTYLVHAACGGSMNNALYGLDGCWYGLRLKKATYDRFIAPQEPAGDGRAAFFYTAGQDTAVMSISNFNEGVAAPKYTNLTSTGAPGSNLTFPDTDFPMFRLADAYLIYIEAFLRGGGGTQAQALTYFNNLRTRAYGNATGNIALAALNPGPAALQLVLDERSRELMWEGHRRSDLIRFGQYTGGTFVWEWKGGTQAGAATDAHLNLFPIPLNELAANPHMTQNAGY